MRSNKGPWLDFELEWPKGIKPKNRTRNFEFNDQSLSSNSVLVDESGEVSP